MDKHYRPVKSLSLANILPQKSNPIREELPLQLTPPNNSVIFRSGMMIALNNIERKEEYIATSPKSEISC